MRAARIPLVSLALVGLVAAGCGGGSKKSGATTASSSGGGDAAAILGSVKTATGGPTKIGLNVTISVSGTPKNAQLSAFTSKPITLTLSGPADTAAKKADLTFSAAAGPLNLSGALREDGDKAWLQFNGKWYTLPASSLSSSSGTGAGSSLDSSKLIANLGAPSKLFRNAKVTGSEDVGGVKSDHVSGDIDIAALVRGLSNVSKSAGGSTPVSPGSVQSAVSQLRKYVKTAKADVYVGQSDKVIHRLSTTIDGVTDASTKASSGIDGFTIKLDVTSTPTSSPSVQAPPSPAPLSQLQQDLGGLMGGLAGGGQAGNG